MSALLLAGKIAGTAALGATAVLTGIQATEHHADHHSAASCGRAFPHASPELKAKLKKARHQPKGQERRKALRELRRDVARGRYGTKSQVGAYRQEVARLRLLAKAPDALKADLKAAAKQGKGERREAVAQVWKDAAAGKYGQGVEKVAQRKADRVTACAAKHDKRGGKTA